MIRPGTGVLNAKVADALIQVMNGAIERQRNVSRHCGRITASI